MKLDVLFVNGRFLTLDPRRSAAGSLGVLGGQVVGLDEEIEGCTAERRVDLGGATVVPGLNDAHHHLSERGRELGQCDVSMRSVATLGELYDLIGQYAGTLDTDAWVLATGFDDAKLGARPDRAGLDRVSGGRPVWVGHASHHAGVLNTEAIRRMGHFDPRNLPDVDNGFVERDADGVPTGYVAEAALGAVHRTVRPVPFDDMVAAIGAGARAALTDGLTSVTEPGICGSLTGNGVADLAAFQAAREAGLLGIRTTVMPEMSALHELGCEKDSWFGLDLGIRSGFGDDVLRLGAVKLFADGALTARTAAVTVPYVAARGEQGDGLGMLHATPERLHELILDAHAHGWQVATHAIGDRAVGVVLNAYADAQRRHPRPDPRHRIEHCGIVTDDQIAQMARLGVIPVPQARFLTELGDAYLAVVGAGRGNLLYRQRSLLDSGIELPGSSDCPVVDGAPMLGIHALVNRELPDGTVLNPGESLTPLQALRAFTIGSAHADRREHVKGTLRRGQLADLTVLSDDPTTVDPARIDQITAVGTVVGGLVRHGQDAFVVD